MLDRPPIIAEAEPAAARRAFGLTLAVAGGLGLLGALHYAWLGLTLSHYDARAHLVVARRILDSLTPGWRQIGAVWLPLPHLIQAIPVQIDWCYRTGASATAVSVVALAWGLAACGRLIVRRTGSLPAALAAPLLVLANPNVLYLQSTPMTEALLFGLSLIALDTVDAWTTDPSPRRARRAGTWIVLLMLTRYEGWFIGGSLVALGALAARRYGARRALALVPWAAGAVIGFLILSKATVGAWFVSSGFFVADNPVKGRPLAVLDQMITTTTALGGPAILWAGVAGVAACLWRTRGRGPAAILPVALLAAGLLPFLAFYEGHPLRVRYMVPLVVGAAVLAAHALSVLPRRAAAAAAAVLVALVAWQRPPLSSEAPMLREAQWEAPYRHGREAVSAALAAQWDGTPILASMGSLAHYMQDASAIGLDIRDFVHEGNADLWDAAVLAPRRHVRWVLIEERAEGGDVLAARQRDDATFLDGFDRVAEGGGVVLYRRRGPPAPVRGDARSGSGS
ncbi:MAG: hypothetical protein R2752_14385 [Vicinamibacterales bacterium]